MHVAFALMIGVADGVDGRSARWSRSLWSLYPLLVTFVVVATANHWWFDAFSARSRPPSRRSRRCGSPRSRPAAWAWPPPARAAAAQQAV